MNERSTEVGTNGGLSQRWRESAEEYKRLAEVATRRSKPDLIREYGNLMDERTECADDVDAAKLRIEEAVKALPRYGFWRDYELITREAVLKIIREIL